MQGHSIYRHNLSSTYTGNGDKYFVVDGKRDCPSDLFYKQDKPDFRKEQKKSYQEELEELFFSGVKDWVN